MSLTTKTTTDEAQLAFIRMRRLATALFYLMLVLYLLTRFFENQFSFLSYVRAFSEAAMVGALADWFAVTALFRRPMGLPIPHTAIIPRSKDRIGQGLGRFISRNFLQPDQVERRLDGVDIAGGFAKWVNESDRANRLAIGISAAIPKLLSILKDGPIADWLQKTIVNKTKNADIGTLLADGIALLTRNKRHKPIVDLIIFHADLAVHSSEIDFRRKVSENTDWLPKLLAIDAAASDALLESIKETLKEAARDPNHSLRTRIDEALSHLEHNLRFDPDLRDQLRKWLNEMAEHEAVAKFVAAVWSDIKAELSENNEERQTKLVKALTNGLSEIGEVMTRDQELKESINSRLKQWAIELSSSQGEAVGSMVAETIKSWDASTVVNQIENAVGRDLQYIRINGTLIGGLVGLLIHTISQLILKH